MGRRTFYCKRTGDNSIILYDIKDGILYDTILLINKGSIYYSSYNATTNVFKSPCYDSALYFGRTNIKKAKAIHDITDVEIPYDERVYSDSIYVMNMYNRERNMELIMAQL